MTKTYDELLEDYEKRGIVPVAPFNYDNSLGMSYWTCPYCNTDVWVSLGGGTYIHCPICCMEIKLE